ncbi:MAG: AraC family transcriptional regulator [Cyanobacteria bacterium P01_A01_bin.135]
MTSLPHPISNVSSIREVAHMKGWSGDGAIYLETQSVEHVFQPPDNIRVCALAEHTLAFVKNAGARRVGQFAGQRYEGAYEANHFFLLPAGTPAAIAWEGRNEAILVSIAPEAFWRVAEQAECINATSLRIKPIVHRRDHQLTRLVHSILHEIQTSDGLGSRLWSESLLTTLNIHLLRHYCTHCNQVKPRKRGLAPCKLRGVLYYINTNLADKDLSLAALSNTAGLSLSYFCHQFKRSTGFTPYQYIIRRRIERAKRLLKQGELPIAVIALECGFSNQSHFYGAFCRIVGTTPKRYRHGGKD